MKNIFKLLIYQVNLSRLTLYDVLGRKKLSLMQRPHCKSVAYLRCAYTFLGNKHEQNLNCISLDLILNFMQKAPLYICCLTPKVPLCFLY